MKIYYKPSNQITIEIEVSDTKEAIAEIASLQELMSHTCGKCKKLFAEMHFQVRTVEDNKYYELVCACGAILPFGAHKKGGGLFPKRYVMEDDGKKWLPNNGWTKWNPETKTRE